MKNVGIDKVVQTIGELKEGQDMLSHARWYLQEAYNNLNEINAKSTADIYQLEECVNEIDGHYLKVIEDIIEHLELMMIPIPEEEEKIKGRKVSI